MKWAFTLAAPNHSLFIKKDDADFLALIVYVDDIVIANNNLKKATDVKFYLYDRFKIKDLGELKYLLGLEIA